jgi:hypothetical protein
MSGAMEKAATEAESGPSIDLLKHQDEELAHLLDPDSGVTYPLTFICGGRGSGKSETDYLQLFLRSERCVDQPFVLAANTDAQLQTFIGIITERLDSIGMKHVFETKAPPKWRKRWRRDGIKVPPRRLRNLKMWIWEDGTHVFCLTLVNNAYTRVKSLDVQAAILEEATEPGVTRAAITTILGAVRCGLGKSKDGTSECRRRGHLHEVVVKFNVPLNDPSNYIYRYHEELTAKEAIRKAQGQAPFYRIIESATLDNPHTGPEYDERLRAAHDHDTYVEQTSGKLRRNRAAVSYHAFSEQNILSTLTYDPRKPLHMWFDWNATPAVAGWGHDLSWDEVPEPERRKGHHYFGIIGELFSDNDPLNTDQVAEALLIDAPRSGLCVEAGCHHDLKVHKLTGSGWLCMTCQWRRPDVTPTQHCSGGVMESSLDKSAHEKYIHAPPNWHGLMKHRGMIHIYADAHDGRGDAAAIRGGSIQIVTDMFTEAFGERSSMIEFHIPSANPNVKERVLAVNRGFRDAHKIASVFVHPRCEAHIMDFREVVPDADGHPLKVSKSPSQRRAGNDYWKRTDISDAWGYHWAFRFPFRRPDSGGMPMGQDDEFDGPHATGWAQP